MRTANPVFGESVFSAPSYEALGTAAMTVGGTVNKALLLTALVIASAMVTWHMAFAGSPLAIPLLVGGAIGGLVLALVTVFKKEWAGVTGPLYCLAEGLVLGVVSALFEARYPGIAIQAVGLTFGVLVTLLLVYRAGLIRATPAFTRGVVAATGAVCVVYLISFVMGFFGMSMPFLHDGGPLGIIVSLVIVVIAALNLVLDFDLIEQGAAAGFPKYMEWYAAFALMVTLIWLYLEILRLLAKLRKR